MTLEKGLTLCSRMYYSRFLPCRSGRPRILILSTAQMGWECEVVLVVGQARREFNGVERGWDREVVYRAGRRECEAAGIAGVG